jgi:hypothetical protein
MKARKTVELERDKFRRLDVKYNMKTCVVIFGIPLWKS